MHGAIVAAAARLLERVGVRDFKMSDLAAEAGVAVGTLYNYFPSREAVIGQLMAEAYARFRVRVAEPCATAEPLGHLTELLHRTLGFTEEHGVIFAELARVSLEHDADLQRCAGRSAREEYLAFRELLAIDLEAAARDGQVRSDVSPTELAVCLSGLVSTTILYWIESGRSHSLAARAEPLLDLFLHGATPR